MPEMLKKSLKQGLYLQPCQIFKTIRSVFYFRYLINKCILFPCLSSFHCLSCRSCLGAEHNSIISTVLHGLNCLNCISI